MGYLLLWVESVCAAVVLLAVVTALAAQARGWWIQRRVPILFGALMIVCAGLAATFVWHVRFNTPILLNGFGSVLSWGILFILTAVVVLILGLKPGPEGGPRARAWPLRRLVLALGALLVLTWITFANLDTAMKMQLESLRADAGARIVALAPTRIPAGVNATPIYLDAFELMAPEMPNPVVGAEMKFDWKKYDRTSVDLKSKEFLAFLQGQQAALSLLREGAAKPGCWFERDYFQGFGGFPDLRQFQRGTTLLAYDALASANRGDGRQALQDVAAIFGIARQLDEPGLGSLLESIDIEEKGLRVLQDVLERAPPKKEDLELVSLHPSEPYRRMLHRAMQMDEAVGLSYFGMLSTEPLPHFLLTLESRDGNKESPFLAAVFGSSFYRVYMLADDLEDYRRHMSEVQELCRRPQYQTIAAITAFEQRSRRKHGILTHLISPALDLCLMRVAMGEAVHRLSRLGLAATAYRLKHGKFPASLEAMCPELMPRIPVDPYDGKPMRMKTDGTDLLIYSIGANLKDDGGAEDPRRSFQDDIVFRLRSK
jgi:hypothetical protein